MLKQKLAPCMGQVRIFLVEGTAEVKRPEKCHFPGELAQAVSVARTIECGWAPGRGAGLRVF